MITNTKLFAIVAIAAISIVGVASIENVYAESILTLLMPDNVPYSEIETTTEGSRSFVSVYSTVSEEGSARLYAKNTSDVTHPQAEVEFTKVFTIESGDTLEITADAYLVYASFYQQNAANESHFTFFPTIHAVGAAVGDTTQVGCDAPIFTEYTSYTSKQNVVSTLICDNLAAGTYEISAYGHARSNNDNSGASTNVKINDVDLKIKRTR